MTDSVNFFEPIRTCGGSLRKRGQSGNQQDQNQRDQFDKRPVLHGATTCELMNSRTNSSLGFSRISANRPLLHDPAGMHDAHPIGKSACFHQIVGHQQHGCPGARKYVIEIALQSGTDQRIERTQRFVQQENLRTQEQGPHQAEPLALPARQLIWIAAQAALGELGHLDQFGQAFIDPLARPAFVSGHQRDVLDAGQMRKQSAFLNDIAQLSPDGADSLEFSGRESTVICPLVGETSPATMRRIVVLPQPLGPRSTTTSPASMER